MTTPFVRPDVATFLGYLNNLPGPKAWEVTPAEARAMTVQMGQVADLPVGEIAVRRDVAMPGPDGGTVTLRLFDARASRGPGPVIVYLHGGGWVLGDLDTYAPSCAEMARILDLPVVSVDYRLAPEHPWPAAPDDCEAAARWVASAPEALGLAPTGIAIAGDSAGGNLTIVVAMALRDAPAAVPLLAHWALYPAVDFVNSYPSAGEFAESYFLTRESVIWFTKSYRPEATHWRASPILHDLAGMAPALVTTASLDPIRDQGRAYAAALAQAGVPVTFREAEGMIHGYSILRKAMPSAAGDFADGLALFGAMIAEAQG